MVRARQSRNDSLMGELERRLAIIARPDYQDPARAALPARDFVALAAFVIAVCLLSYLFLH